MSLSVALVGNPNTGKSTLFNRLTGLRRRVGNYPGITVDLMEADIRLSDGRPATLVDLPGCYSLSAWSSEESVAIRYMLGMDDDGTPDLVVVCVDATQLLRNLYLVLQIQELGIPTVVALTMTDEAGSACPDPTLLSQRLGCPVVATVPRDGIGITELLQAVTDATRTEAAPRWRWTPSDRLRDALASIRTAAEDHWPNNPALHLWALSSVSEGDELQGIPAPIREAVLRIDDLPSLDDEIIQARYDWLDTQVGPLVGLNDARNFTDKVDRVVTHPVFGFAAFLAVMFLMFQSLFAWSDPAIGAIEDLFGLLGSGITAVLPAGLFQEFLVDGLISGVGAVLVFLPQILLLFFFIGLMEDSGYMARVAMLMDRIMRAMGLNGKAFVPMLSGFACAVPAILATRTMERKRDRLLTMMVVPLMTCSARLPVYTLVIGTLFLPTDKLGPFGVQGLLMVAMYLFGTAMALIVAWVLSKTVLRAPRVPLVLELPPYRLPRLPDVLRMMWSRTQTFLREAGTVIAVATIILWALLRFPTAPEITPDDTTGMLASTDVEQAMSLEELQAASQLENSFGGRFGHFIEPVIEPLGFDWKIGVGLVGSFAAREVFVSTMGVIYAIGDVDEESTALREKMRTEVHADGSKVWTPLTGLALMVFFALASQCLSTLAVVKKESGSWAWTGFLFTYMTVLAFVAAWMVRQGGLLLGFS